MIDGIRLKFCGLTTLVDVEFADRLGADYLGFILYPKSSRYLSLRQFRDMAPLLPDGRKKVAVIVEPSDEELRAVLAAGFDRVQIHFRLSVTDEVLGKWSEIVGPERLWLAPKLPPADAVPTRVMELAKTVLWDTFHKDGYGGSGLTGDWTKFKTYRERWPKTQWVLAGGLNPENVGEALKESGTNFLDLSSGVETRPGIKDHAKMKALVLAIHRARASG